MERNCTVCGGNGHNQRTCSEKHKSIKLFGVEINTKKDCMERRIKKGNPWTEDEHIAFLKGLDFHGKGNWAKIAKDFVPSRTSTQVASHAQKYFMRLLDANSRKYRKKSSVFDLRLEKTHHAIVPHGNNQQTPNVPSFVPIENNHQSVQKTHNVPTIVPLGNNHQSVQETHTVPPSYYMMKRVPAVLPLTWVYMYPYHHHYASTSASAATFDEPLSGISSSSSPKDSNFKLTL